MSEYVPEGQAEVTPEPVEEPWYTQVSQEDFEAMRDTHQQLQQAIQAAEQQPQEQGQDGFDPDDFLTAAQVQQLIDQRTQPLQQYTYEQQMQESQSRAKDIASDYATQKGYELSVQTPDGQKVDMTDMVLDHANRYMPEMSQKFGQNSQRAAEAAIAKAADSVMGAMSAAQKSYYEQQVNQLQGLRNAPRELPATGPQAGQQLHDRGGSEVDLVSQFFNGR